jgi:cob(I)alamin adenosyltransferase
MPIYTRRGDHGETSLADGSRIRKDSARVEAYGAVDEANSAVGLARAAVTDPALSELLCFAQQRLFNCSAALAAPAGTSTPTTPRISHEDVAALEAAVDRFETVTGPPAGFVVEGGSEAASRLHTARAILRRAERRVVTLDAETPVDEQVLAFINRLSDALFAGARYANELVGHPDELWDPAAPLPAEGSARP